MAASSVSTFVHISASLGWHIPPGKEYWISIGNPYFPIQVIFAICLGWSFGRALPHPYMGWVWVLPFIILCYCFCFGVVLIPEWTSVLVHPNSIHARLSYYFGASCQPAAHCLDRLIITMPFYASVAYSLGTKLSRHWIKQSPRPELRTN